MSRRAAEERLQRLLVMLPWLMEHERVPIAEVADRCRDNGQAAAHHTIAHPHAEMFRWR